MNGKEEFAAWENKLKAAMSVAGCRVVDFEADPDDALMLKCMFDDAWSIDDAVKFIMSGESFI